MNTTWITSSKPVPVNGPRDAPARPQQIVLAALLLAEIALFSAMGDNFLTFNNAFEILRLSVEIGLLALALTPVIVTGGIDLSVGSLLGLCAVMLGVLWQDVGLSPWLAAAAAVAIGGSAGGFNGWLISRLRIPPLIVTLGTFSLFRGLAEGITRGARNFTGFPESFKFLGVGYIGPIPAQLPLFVAAAVGFWVLLHRSTIGRGLSAIGYSPDGARHAGIPVERRIALTYVLSGLAAGLAAVVYVAHLGQARADAGTGYELAAITAVVLGGTSIFGGRGSIGGTLLGLFAIAVLRNGLRLSSLPSLGIMTFPESVAETLTGLLLLIAIGLEWRPSLGHAGAGSAGATIANPEELNMRNSQLAVLSIVILLAAAIVAGGNFLLVRSIRNDTSARAPGSGSGGGGGGGGGGPTPAPGGKRMTIAMMPKSLGNAYFKACRKGADEAAAELGVDLIWDGPTNPDPAKQNEIVETWITRGVDAIAVAVENRGGLSSVLKRAREKGIKVVTFDADADPAAREFFVNQATPEGIGYTLMDSAAEEMGGKGKFAIITATLTAQNMIDWQQKIEQRRAAKYPDITLAALEPCDDKQEEAFAKAKTIMNAHPDVKLIMAICSPAVPGAAEAVEQAGRRDVKVIGLGLPNQNKGYVHAGVTQRVILWNTMDLGYLAVRAAHAVKGGTLNPGDKTIDGGRLGKVEIQGDNIVLGRPVVFTKANIDQFDF